ncbi:MAG TPA: PilW family protein [Lysobacter sp.]
MPRQRGMSLIELMVGMVLGLLLLGAVLQVYLSTKMTFNTQDQKSVLEESGRYALEFIARDVRMAGLTGCSSRFMPDAQLQVRNHLNGGAAFPWEFMTAVRGFEATDSGPGKTLALTSSDPAPGGTWNAVLPAAVAALAVPGSDVLLLGGTGAQTWPLVDPFTQGAQIFVQTGNDIAQGDVLFVTDCSQGFVFQASNISQAGGKTNVTGAKGGGVTPGNGDAISEQGPNGGAFRQGAMVARASSTAYFIGRSVNGAPALFRASLLAPDNNSNARQLRAEELITGIESMQLLYGLDTDGNFAVDQYQPAGNVADWGEVRTVRAAFLARADAATLQADDTATYPMLGTNVNPVDDRRQRRVFEMTISLRNRLP